MNRASDVRAVPSFENINQLSPDLMEADSSGTTKVWLQVKEWKATILEF
jgi:ABC-type Fe3+-citrate transport system substrate-binding protein